MIIKYDYSLENNNITCKTTIKNITKCVCPETHEGEYCQKPISNICEFTKVHLNDIALIANRYSFYTEFLDSPKIYYDINNSFPDVKFNLKLACSRLNPTAKNRQKINEFYDDCMR